ncbi:peptide/nickel transport system permease protein/oligopeptide transport system permease protein [Halanaerobium saccharolyticum]|uniref:Peptide/nickel transport system permease protein/oligopeptide transport system permease protein n=1 Tax=Halanaerobium saccharolyticum TaxID=43595 RepID=A0A4R7YTA9_9FIRM|nr:ABC transporter permease [Halanaerobium saccharolyticum]RAK06496.1 peptide/nickel transport system permease protein/oligopeptide transport system permease protein [Halanaerobium saccharolyticum]TDW01040.1 peptide/nickel transport system permease protein/oligopeptide transport system permease protein [Halanaerobium saccharolyticum]TDX52621.1 peptide/nickel transport system permease protein/oligopeptide transport system permease protein [Halanaerobium saccharolyticum]
MFKSQKFFRFKKKTIRVIKIMKKDYKAYLGGSIIMLILISAIFAPLIAPADPYETNVAKRLEGPSLENLLGTDSLGRDILSRLIYAARPAVLVSFGGIILSLIIGIILGLLAAYVGGILENLILFIFDVIRAFPPIILILVLLSIVGPSLLSVVVILGVTIMPRYGRVVRADTLSEKEEDFVEAARSLGAGNSRIIFKHILPNIFASVLVLSGMDMASMIMWEAGLSFLGLGLQPPLSSWGVMLQESYQYIQTAPLMIVWPALAIMLTMLGFSTFAESLRVALNPKLNQEV